MSFFTTAMSYFRFPKNFSELAQISTPSHNLAWYHPGRFGTYLTYLPGRVCCMAVLNCGKS